MTVAVEPHDVDSTMQFIRPDSTINRRYIVPGKEVNTGKYEVKQVHIKDARPKQDEYTLDKNGFQIFNHKTSVRIPISMQVYLFARRTNVVLQ